MKTMFLKIGKTVGNNTPAFLMYREEMRNTYSAHIWIKDGVCEWGFKELAYRSNLKGELKEITDLLDIVISDNFGDYCEDKTPIEIVEELGWKEMM